MMSEFFSWEILATFAGAAMAVMLLVEVTKGYVPLDPKWTALVYALIIMYGVQIFVKGDLEAGAYIVSFFNSLLIAGTAIGIFESTAKYVERANTNKESGESQGQ